VTCVSRDKCLALPAQLRLHTPPIPFSLHQYLLLIWKYKLTCYEHNDIQSQMSGNNKIQLSEPLSYFTE